MMTNQENSRIYFTDQTKMSLNLIELRLDNHLERIMKAHRLANFCNAIKKLPVQSRICEKLLEVMVMLFFFLHSLQSYKIRILFDFHRILVKASYIVKCH